MALIGGQLSYWTFLLILSLGLTGTYVAVARLYGIWKKNEVSTIVKKGLALGLFLAVFDWFFETGGALAGYWFSYGSAFFVGPYVPLEVSLIAVCAGVVYHSIFPKKFSWLLGVSSSVIIAVIGAGIEASLNEAELLVYQGGWSSLHALVSYFLVFLMVYLVNSWLNSRKIGK